jgi:uracil-DNA glycosylase
LQKLKSEKQAKLDQIKADILSKNICPDLAKTAKQLVFGEGNPDADIVFVGEAPGKKEDEQGVPFVGASGSFLGEMLALINLRREDIYITNIVKYRPPNNRDPLQSEKEAFLPFLQAQLQVIKPKLIVTLGRHSMDAVLPGLKIGQAHGILIEQKGTYYLPLFHPAAALYNGGLRQTLIEDFNKIPNIIQEIQKF